MLFRTTSFDERAHSDIKLSATDSLQMPLGRKEHGTNFPSPFWPNGSDFPVSSSSSGISNRYQFYPRSISMALPLGEHLQRSSLSLYWLKIKRRIKERKKERERTIQRQRESRINPCYLISRAILFHFLYFVFVLVVPCFLSCHEQSLKLFFFSWSNFSRRTCIFYSQEPFLRRSLVFPVSPSFDR